MTLKALKMIGIALAGSAVLVVLIAWGVFLLWLGLQGARALAHLF